MYYEIIRVPVVLFLVGIGLSPNAQINDNFEFLDHRVRSSRLGASTMMGDKIYYVSHNDVLPWTTFNVVDGDRNVETLLELKFDYSSSKLFTINDTSVVMIIDNLIDYDIYVPGYFMINITPSGAEIDTLFREWGFNELYVSDVILDSLGRQIISSNQGYLVIDEGNRIELLDLEPTGELLYNVNYDLFSFNFRSISGFDGIEFQTLIQQEDDFNFREIMTDKTQNYVLESDRNLDKWRLEVFNVDFTDILLSVDLPYQVTTLDQFNFYDDEIHFITSHDSLLEIMAIDSQGSISTIHKRKFKDEVYSKIIPLQDSRYLVMGAYGPGINQYGGSNYSRNIFFRNYSTIDSNEYERVNIKVEQLDVNRLSSDTTDIISRTGLPTVYYIKHNYNFKLGIENLGPESISYLNVFSKNKLDGTDPKLHFDFEYQGELEARKDKEVDFPYEIYNDLSVLVDTTILPLFIPGADFKFNENPFWDFEVLVDVEELVEDASFSLYPNPTKDILRLKVDRPIRSILIYDLNGLLMDANFSSSSFDKIDVSNLPAGSYFLRANIKNENQYLMSKFVKF